MRAIYIKPVAEKVTLHVKEDITWGKFGTSQEPDHTANEHFFDDEDIDYDDYDPFFDE